MGLQRVGHDLATQQQQQSSEAYLKFVEMRFKYFYLAPPHDMGDLSP